MKKTVLVTGCFDVLHQAHKDFLKAAKKQGDELILGLESDKRIKKLKGKNRPINSWPKRKKVLAELNLADNIFPLPKNFKTSKAQKKLLKTIKPQVLAVSEKTPYLAKKKRLTKKLKIKLFVFPHNPKHSTSKLLARV